MQKVELVFVPAPAIGHLVSTAEFAKLLLERDDRLSITILVAMTEFPPDVSAYARSLEASQNNRVRFIYLPPTDFPFEEERKRNVEMAFSNLIESYKPHVKDAIIKHVLSNSSTKLVALVVDLFCTSMIEVANDFNVPSYLFFTSGAAFLGFMMLYLPIHHNNFRKVFEFSDPASDVPTFSNPVPPHVLPSAVFNEGGGYECFLKHGILFKETKGIIINTFSELETYAIDALELDKETPPIYPVGPILDLKNSKKGSMDENERIMKWLDDQPHSSVLFLCFGSLGGFEPPQLVQIAIALKRSGMRFLWSVRPPTTKNITRNVSYDCNDDGLFFRKGFLEETKDRGIICGWAPQVDVLAHKAIGGFVSHCGWNSTLESLWFGVPIAAWPIYAEQQINAFQMVKELGLAVEIKMDYRIGSEDIVSADEIEKVIISLMDKNNPARKRVADMRDMSRKTVCDGGSSFASMRCFIEKIMEESSKS